MPSRRASSHAAIAIAATALVLTPIASATIVPQRSMAGISLGMSRMQVTRLAGKPLRAEHRSNEFGSLSRLVYAGSITVDFQGNRTVTAISTTGRRERTARGLGVGSTRADVQRLVPGIRCETTAGFAHCYVGRFEPGRRVTDFRLSYGVVTRVTVGFVVD